MLMSNILLQDGSADSIKLSVKAFLSNGEEAILESYQDTISYSVTRNYNFINQSGGNNEVIRLSENASSGEYATVQVILEGAKCTLDVYVFVPAGYLNNDSLDNNSLMLLDGLQENKSTIFVPETVEENSTAYKEFKKGDSYNFGEYFKPTVYNPTNLVYSMPEEYKDKSNITDAGLWTAAEGITGGDSFKVTLTSSNTYKGRVFHSSNFTRTCIFRMPTYIYDQSGLSSLSNAEGDYYLRNDITLSGYWSSITKL